MTTGIVATKYLFNGSDGTYPVLAVAKLGTNGDWAAYVAGIPVFVTDTDNDSIAAQRVAEFGAKLTEEIAHAWFPTIEGEYRS